MASMIQQRKRLERAARHWPLCLVVACGPALAGEVRQAATLPAVTVSGERDAATVPVSLGKLPLSMRETPQSISVIGQDQLRQQNLQSLEDAMRHATGITVQPHHHLTTAFFTRGFQIDSFEQDGVPVLMANRAGSPEDLAVYERIEILRGANGLLHGSGNPAATINLVRKRPQREFSFGGALSAGSWDRYRAEVDLGGPLDLGGSVRGRVVGVAEDRGFFYETAHQATGLFYGIGELDAGPDTTLSAGLQYQRIRSHPPTSMGGLPRYTDGGDIGLKRSTNLESAGSRSNWTTMRVFADLDHRFANGWNAKVSVNHLNADSYIKYLTFKGAIDRQTGEGSKLTGGASKFDNIQTSIDGYATGPVELLGRRHELLFGVNAMRTVSEQYSAKIVSPSLAIPVNVFTWHPRDLPAYDVGPYASRGATRMWQRGVYGVGRFNLAAPLTLALGGRMSWWTQDDPAAHQRISPEFTPYGGFIVDLGRRWSAYASYAQVFQPQTEQTRDGGPLDPVVGTNYEAGVKGELADGALNASLAVFQIQQKNRAQADPSLPCIGKNCYYVAGGEVRSRGFEAETAGSITPYWTLVAGYTFNTTKYLTDTRAAGQPYASYTPRHTFRLWTDYALPLLERRLSVGGGLQIQSGFYSVAGPFTLRQGGYALVDLRVAYRAGRHVTVALNANNLFDRVYYQRVKETNWESYYGEPRNVMLTVRAEY
ncbi:TonB-dependent siderophore receptor [Achromobacter xylosoxidans]